MTLETNCNEINEINGIKPTKPINYLEIIEDLLRDPRIEEKYIISMVNEIISEGLSPIPTFKIELRDLDPDLSILFRQDPHKFLEYFRGRLYDRLLYDIDVKDLFENFGIKAEDLYIIPDAIDLDNLIPEVNDFSEDLTIYKERVCRFIGRYMNIGLYQAIEFKKIIYQCQLCGNEFEIIPTYRKTREQYQIPTFCMNVRCKGKKSRNDIRILEEKSSIFEVRSFMIGDIDINKSIYEKKCIILKNIPYFIEKAKTLNLNEEIEVLGILHIDPADIYLRKEEHEILYYIEVLDIKPKESKIRDDNIINQLKEELERDPDYCNEIIDSIHPYSKNIYDYFSVKLLMCLSVITCDSWDERENKRNSLNVIIGGHKGLLKTRIGRAIQEILGQNVFGIIYGSNTTSKGLIPTAQRNNSQKDLVKRYGALAYFNKNILLIDEAQYLKEDSLECLKCLDDGKIARALDGTIINASTKESVILSLNYKTENEAYDYSKSLIENLGFPEDQLSILDRFDLHYAIPNLKEKINKILFRRSFKPIIHIESKERIYNYLFEAKRLYSEGIIITPELISIIEELNNFFFQKNKPNRIITPREPIILAKIIKGICALRFKKEVDNSDIEYLKKHLIHTIIPFQGNDSLIDIRIIEMDEIFKKTIILLTELYQEIPIADHIEFIREFLESHYFPYPDPIMKDPLITYKINEFIGPENNLSNWKYRELIEKPKNIEYIKQLGYIIGKKDKATYFIYNK